MTEIGFILLAVGAGAVVGVFWGFFDGLKGR